MSYNIDFLKPIRELKNTFISEFESHNKQKEFQLFEKTSIFNKKYKQTLASYNNAIKQISKQKYDKAKSLLTEILSTEKSFFPAWLNLGLIASKSGELKKALEYYTNALSVNPEYDIAYFNRAILYEKLEEFNLAIQDYEFTLDVSPDFHKARASLFLLHNKLGNVDKATNHLFKLTELIPESPYIYFLNYEYYLDINKFDKAYLWLRKTKQHYPQNGDFFYCLGWLAFFSSDLSESIKFHEIALKFRPLDLDTVYNLSIVKINAGLNSDGIALFSSYIERKYKINDFNNKLLEWEKIGEIFPKLPEIKMVIAEQYYSIGKIKNTLDILKTMKKEFKEHLPSRVFLAEIFYDLGKYGDSIQEWQDIILDYTDYVNGYNKLGQIYAMLGNMTSAIVIWKKAEQKFPDNSEFKYQLALVYATENNFEKAYNYIKEAKKLNPTSKKILKRIKEIKILVDNVKKRNFY